MGKYNKIHKTVVEIDSLFKKQFQNPLGLWDWGQEPCAHDILLDANPAILF